MVTEAGEVAGHVYILYWSNSARASLPLYLQGEINERVNLYVLV